MEELRPALGIEVGEGATSASERYEVEEADEGDELAADG